MRLVRFHDEVASSSPQGPDEVPASELVQPDECDRIRIRRALRHRRRYRYVLPKVRTVSGAIRIESPCCSRKLDPSGGMVDIALIQHLRTGEWRLHRMDHQEAAWRLHGVYERLEVLLQLLNEDPERLFWQ